MPIEFDGPNSKVSADTIAGQGGSTITIQSGHSLSGSGSGLTALPAANLTGTLPAISGVNLTALNATNLGSGTLPDARFPATLPAASGVNLTALNGSNIASGTVAAARLPALGKVVQIKRIYLKNSTSSDNVTYSTSGSALNGTLDSNGIYRLKNADSEYLTIPSFSATSGNMLIAWGTYAGGGDTSGASNHSYGVEWGSASLRTYTMQGYGPNAYGEAGSFMTSTVLSSNLSSVSVHAILRMEENSKTTYFRFNTASTSATNWGTEGASAETTDISLTVMEVGV